MRMPVSFYDLPLCREDHTLKSIRSLSTIPGGKSIVFVSVSSPTSSSSVPIPSFLRLLALRNLS